MKWNETTFNRMFNWELFNQDSVFTHTLCVCDIHRVKAMFIQIEHQFNEILSIITQINEILVQRDSFAEILLQIPFNSSKIQRNQPFCLEIQQIHLLSTHFTARDTTSLLKHTLNCACSTKISAQQCRLSNRSPQDQCISIEMRVQSNTNTAKIQQAEQFSLSEWISSHISIDSTHKITTIPSLVQFHYSKSFHYRFTMRLSPVSSRVQSHLTQKR
jgi:hypothetical protein